MRRSTLVSAVSLALISFTAGAQEAPTAKELDNVVVYGRLKGESIREIPQSVDVLGPQLIEATGAETVGEVLRMVPGASRDGSELDAFGDSYLMRGFSTTQTVNGIGTVFLNQPRDAVNVDLVEVLKGPASVLYGQAQPGAIINVVTKQPERTFGAQLGLQVGSYDHARGTFDVTGSLGDRVRGRITGAAERGDSFIDDWSRDHQFVSPVLAFDLSDRTTLTLETYYTRTHWSAFFNGIPAEGTVLANPNGPLPRGTQYTDPAFDGIIRSANDVTARLEHSFSDALSWRLAVSSFRSRNSGEELFGLLGWEDAEQRLLMRALMDADSRQDSNAITTDVRWTFNTGGMRHRLLAGADWRRSQLDLSREIGLIDSLDLYAPVLRRDTKPAVFFAIDDLSDDTDRTSEAYGVFLQDRVEIGDRLDLVAGVRYSKLDESLHRSTQAGDVEDFRQAPSKWTSQLGAVYDLSASTSLFANRTTSFLPTEGTLFTGEPLPPETGVQTEIGLRSKFADGRISTTLAAYEITRGDVSVGDPAHPSYQISIGEQRVRGVEATARWLPTTRSSVYLAYAYTDSETTADTDTTLVGRRLRGVPRNTFAADGAYDFDNGFSVGATVNYVGRRSADLYETFELPDYWRVDARIGYRLSPRLRFTAAVENLTDERIYSHAYGLYEVFPAAPRTWRVGVELTF